MSTIVHSLRDYRPPSKTQQFAESFCLPPDEGPYVDAAGNRAEIVSAVLTLSNPEEEGQEDLVYVGRLTLTPSFLCFSSQLDRGRGCRVALPLSTVRRVERLNTRDAVFALSITVWHGMQLIFQLNALRPSCEGFCNALRNRLRAHLSEMKQLKPFLAGCYSEYLIKEGAESAAPDDPEASSAQTGTLIDTEKEHATGSSAPANDRPYHMGLGERFGFPGDPKKYVSS